MKDTMTPPVEEAIVVEESKDIPFGEALLAAVAGKRISRREWKDIRHYGVIRDNLLHLHKAGESADKFHLWVVHDNDILGSDWFILPNNK